MDEIAAHKLLQDAAVSRKPNLDLVLSQLRELVEKLRAQRLDQSASLTQNEQSKLVEATKILRSIKFEDLSPLLSREAREHKEFGSKRHGASVAAVTHTMDLKSLEALAQSIFGENESQTPQPALQMTRTDYVVFPPELTEKKAAFDGVLKVVLADVAQLGASVHYSETDRENIPFSVSIAGQAVEDEKIITKGEYTHRVRFQMGDVTSIRNHTSENSVELQPVNKTSNPDTAIHLPLITERAEEPTLAKQTLHSGTQLPSPSISKGAQELDSTVTPVKENGMSNDDVTLRGSNFRDFDPSKVAKTTQSEMIESATERKSTAQPIQAISYSEKFEGDQSISKAKLVVQQIDEKLQNVSVHSNEQPRPIKSSQSYERPFIQSDNALLGNTELTQVTRQAKGKDIGAQHSVKPILPKGELVEGKSETFSKPQTDAQTSNLELASAKTALRGAENMLHSEQGKVKNIVDDPISAAKEAITKKVVSGQKKGQGLETVKHPFELPQPKLKQTPFNREFPLKLPATVDFSARAVGALMSQVQTHISKKSTGSAGAVTVSPVSIESGMLLQNSLDIVNHNGGAQKHVGSERLERWIDTQLDLTSRGWVNNLAKTMVSAINRGQQRLMLALSPPSLGRINIVFNAKSTGLDLRIHAERKATLSLLGDAEIKLVSNLENAGHKVNNLSYAEMSASANNFGFNYNQGSNNVKDGADERDLSEQEKVSETAQVAHEESVAKNIDDASLVNITV